MASLHTAMEVGQSLSGCSKRRPCSGINRLESLRVLMTLCWLGSEIVGVGETRGAEYYWHIVKAVHLHRASTVLLALGLFNLFTWVMFQFILAWIAWINPGCQDSLDGKSCGRRCAKAILGKRAWNHLVLSIWKLSAKSCSMTMGIVALARYDLNDSWINKRTCANVVETLSKRGSIVTLLIWCFLCSTIPGVQGTCRTFIETPN